MNKLILAVTALATLTTVSTLPASAQSRVPCTANYCGETGGSSSNNCDSSMWHLPRVYPAEVMAVDEENRVWITELCADFSKLSSEGNAAYLRKYIRQNDVLLAALQGKGYFPEDVFAVQMMGSDDTVNLYVHKFGR